MLEVWCSSPSSNTEQPKELTGIISFSEMPLPCCKVKVLDWTNFVVYYINSPANMGSKFTTPRSRVSCSKDRASLVPQVR